MGRGRERERERPGGEREREGGREGEERNNNAFFIIIKIMLHFLNSVLSLTFPGGSPLSAPITCSQMLTQKTLTPLAGGEARKPCVLHILGPE